MKRSLRFILTTLLVSRLVSLRAKEALPPSPAQAKTNILLLYLDNVGHGDLGCVWQPGGEDPAH